VTIAEAGTGAPLARLDRSASLGVLAAPLAAGPVAIHDRRELLVQLHAGHLAAVDDEALLAGANRLAIETDAGGWEILGFGDAELVSPGLYRLGTLLRGLDGTDPAMGAAAAGSSVVVLDARVQLVEVPAAWLGDSVALTAFAGTADSEGSAIGVALGLAPLLPLPPVHLRARRAGGDIALSWVRRSRADTQSWAAADVPLEHAPEAYRVTILDGGVPVRQFDSAGPATLYSAAEQAADFGGPAPGFTWSVAQLSPVYGPGPAANGAS
jgi:hypothetical protein